jgi:hypothetical protein
MGNGEGGGLEKVAVISLEEARLFDGGVCEQMALALERIGEVLDGVGEGDVKQFVWLSGGAPVLFEARDEEEAFRRVLAARLSVHCSDVKNPSREILQSCVNWSAQEDTIVEVNRVNRVDLSEVFEGEVPEPE